MRDNKGISITNQYDNIINGYGEFTTAHFQIDLPFLEDPDLEFPGFRMWIHYGAFDLWLQLSAVCTAPGINVLFSGLPFMLDHVDQWMKECESLYHNLEGKAVLSPKSEGLKISFSSNKTEVIQVEIHIQPKCSPEPCVVRYELKQSDLLPIIIQCQTLITRDALYFKKRK